MTLLAELRRRNVFRMAGLYLVGAWLVVQVAATLLPVFEAPGWVMKLVVVVLAIGFVAALVFSWIYELTPEGIKRDSGVAEAPAVQQRMLRKLDLAIIALLLASLALLVWNRLHPAAPATDAAADTAEVKAALGPHSIAVLPFASFSAAYEDRLFADGLADTVLNTLAQVRQLRVIARNSSFTYQGSNVDVRTVGAELGVASVLEGSVQRQGERLRVIAQLVETRGGSHLWSQTYDRPVADLFAIQDEIAAAVVKALKVELLADGAGTLQHAVAIDPRAREQLIAARGLAEAFRLSRDEDDARQWRDAVLAAARLDPAFTEAWIELADVEQTLAFVASDAGARQAAIERGYRALRRALVLEPDSLQALGVMSWLLLREGREAESLALNLTLLDRSPNDTASMRAAGLSLWTLMRPAEALALQEKALVLDPWSRGGQRQRGVSLVMLGRLDEARDHFLAGVERDPAFPINYVDLAVIDGPVRGDWVASVRWLLRGLREAPQNPQLADGLIEALQALALDEAAERWATQASETRTADARAILMARLRAMQGRHAEALAAYRASSADDDPKLLREQRGTFALRLLLGEDEAGARAQLAKGLDELSGGLGEPFQIGTDWEFANAALLGLVAVRTGDARGESLLRLALERVRSLPAQGPVHGFSLLARHHAEAELLAALGETEAALAALAQGLPDDDERVLLFSLTGGYLGDSPYLQALHAEPRFNVLMAEFGRRRAAAAHAVTAALIEHERRPVP